MRALCMFLALILPVTAGFAGGDSEGYSLTVEFENLRSPEGTLIVALYNKDGTIPDEKFEHYYKIGQTGIVSTKAQYTFTDLPEGTYAVSVLHDENNNGKIDKKFIVPKEGIGFPESRPLALPTVRTLKKHRSNSPGTRRLQSISSICSSDRAWYRQMSHLSSFVPNESNCNVIRRI